MRYASLAQGIEFLSNFGGFIPSGEENFSKLPPPATQERFSDEQLYALAMYLYSLRPPPNPNRLDAMARTGQRVFEREGCAGCHTPPLYTNNKLLPVSGFQVPDEHLNKYDILNVPIETDPGSRCIHGAGPVTTKSRRCEACGTAARLTQWIGRDAGGLVR